MLVLFLHVKMKNVAGRPAPLWIRPTHPRRFRTDFDPCRQSLFDATRLVWICQTIAAFLATIHSMTRLTLRWIDSVELKIRSFVFQRPILQMHLRTLPSLCFGLPERLFCIVQ